MENGFPKEYVSDFMIELVEIRFVVRKNVFHPTTSILIMNYMNSYKVDVLLLRTTRRDCYDKFITRKTAWPGHTVSLSRLS